MESPASDTPFITNQEIARSLFQVAALLETIEGNPYRIRAYRRTALAVLFLPKPLAEYFSRDEEAPLPGVGERMRRKLGELVNTGHFSTHDTLLDEVGEPMLSLLSVQGIGPRTAIRLVRELRVSSLQDLADAANAGKIQTLPGFGAKREALIAAAVDAQLESAA
jgi:DNA polymerase (family 10)